MLCVFGCKHISLLVCLHFISVGFPTGLKAGRDFWHCDETLHPSSQTKHGRGSQQDVAPAKSCSLPGEIKGIFLLRQNIANSCSYGLVPCHGTVTLVFKVPNVWLVELMCEHMLDFSFPRVASMPFGCYESNSVCLRLPSPVLEVPKSKSSLVTFWESRYVAGTQPCSSAVLTNHQPVERETQQDRVNIGTFPRCFTHCPVCKDLYSVK